MSEQQRTQALLGPADPARDAGVPPARLSAVDLIAQAEAGTAAGQPRPTRRLVLVAAGAVAVTAAGGAVAYPLLHRGTGGERATVPPRAGTDLGLVVPVAYQINTGAPPAGNYLRQLAASLTDAPVDQHTGKYAYRHMKAWGGAVMTSPEGYVRSYVEDVQTWRAADGSGLQRTRQFAAQYPDEASRRYWQKVAPSEGGTGSHDLNLPPDSNYDPPPPVRPAAMARYLRADGGTADVLGNIAHVYEKYAVLRPVRAAILAVLAEQKGLLWRGKVTDRAGRPGVAVTFDDSAAHQEQVLLVFDPHTGELIANELLGVGKLRREVNAYLLFLAQDRTDHAG
jgi:hypothetical protein